MARFLKAAFAAMLALFAACGDAPTSPSVEPVLDITIASAMVEAMNEAQYLDPILLRPERVCYAPGDPSPWCCPPIDEQTGRGHAVSTVYNREKDELWTFGPTIVDYPVLVLSNQIGEAAYLVWGIEEIWREPPEWTDLPGYVFDLSGLPSEYRYALHFCPGDLVSPLITPDHARGTGMSLAEVDSLGFVWDIPRPN